MTRRSRGKRSRRTPRRTATRNIISGRRIRTRPDIPAITEVPWNQATVQLGFAADTDMTVSAVWSVLCSQLGLFVSAGGTRNDIAGFIRFRKIRIWSLQNSRPVKLLVNDLQSPNQELTALIDWPGQNHFPALGYVWPQTSQTVSFASGSTTTIASIDVSATDPVVAYVDLLWRGYGEGVADTRERQTSLAPITSSTFSRTPAQ